MEIALTWMETAMGRDGEGLIAELGSWGMDIEMLSLA